VQLAASAPKRHDRGTRSQVPDAAQLKSATALQLRRRQESDENGAECLFLAPPAGM
jgi:hypothetical protein